MDAFYDLHIHSALSPCADNDMTPNNIINMAYLKGLRAVAVCDHNCADNIPALDKAAKSVGITFVPGIEISTAEEVHILAFFNEVEAAVGFGTEVYEALPPIQNKVDYFGHQYIMDENDEITGEKDKLLISALPLGINECFDMIGQHGGIAVPAHVNKETTSILANLGFFPEDIQFATVEVWRAAPLLADVSKYNVIYDSDAHTLEQISEKEHKLDVEECSREEIIKKLCTMKSIM